MNMILLLGLALIFVSLSVITVSLWPDDSKRVMRERLRREVGRRDELGVVKVLSSVLEPVHRVLPLKGYLKGISTRLDGAGVQMPPIHFLVLQELAAVVAGGFYIYYWQTNSAEDAAFNSGWLLGSMLIGIIMPVFWVNGRVKKRQETVARDLPEVVDLLSLCVGAGADFISALSRIVREFRECPVREELAVVLSEIRVGKSRRDALRGFARRIQTPESSTFSRTLIQADRMGTGLVDALKVLSEDMREARYHWAERFAQKAPLKMLLPLMISLMCAMTIVVAPVLIQFFRGGIMNMAGSM